MDRKKEYKYLGLIILSMIAACVETDIYLPAFVDMMQYFSVSEGAIQSLLTWNFFGICLSGPLYGPLSDSFGRKKPLLIALAIFFVGSLVALAATTLPLMFIGRILQGLGSGGCFTLGFAIIFDAFQQEKAVKAMNRLCTFIPVIMAAAPLAGGMLNNHFGFRSNFLAIALLSFLSLFFCFLFLEETLDKSKRSSFQWSTLRNDFKQVLSHKGFWQLGLATSAIFSGYIAFLSGTSVLFIMELGLTKEQFPFVQAALLGAWVLAGLVVNKAIHWWGSDSIKKQGLILCLIGAISTLVISWIAPKDPYLLTAGMMVYAFGANWVFGLYLPQAMELLPKIKGTVSSLLTSIRLLIATATVELVGLTYNKTVYPLVMTVFGSALILFLMLFLYEREQRKKTLSSPG